MDRPRLRVFGERNSGTRAVIRMLADSDSFDLDPRLLSEPINQGRLARLTAEVDARFRGPWARIYGDAIKDLRAYERGALGA
ncbi:MAG: hypothetical protein AAFW69_12260, partial [Pseudomonadota bacterium]